jgi:single-stranded-DNA-specific exonuclease
MDKLQLSHTAKTIIHAYAERRGVETSDQLQTWLNPRISPSQYPLPDANKAFARLDRAISAREKVLIFGDYDADGITSTSILLRFFRECTSLSPAWRLPNRQTDHYGLDLEAAKKLVAEHNPSLLITIDCGTNSREAITWLKNRAVDTIIIDHHLVYSQATDAVALVNPKAHPSFACGDLENLCAAGLALHLCAFLAEQWGCAADWDNQTAVVLAGLGTLADSVPVSTSNRAIVKNALLLINTPAALARCVGLSALVPKDGQRIGQRRLQFEVVPALNALGRLDSAAPGVTLLTTADEVEAKTLAERCKALNTERKNKQAETVSEAIAQGEELLARTPGVPVLILARDWWHHGVAGPAASKVTEKFGRSVIVLAPDVNGQWKGSGRAHNSDNLGEWLVTVKRLGFVTRGGGHAGAVGVGVTTEQIEQLRIIAAHIPMSQIVDHEPEAEVMGDVDLLTPEEWTRVGEILEPFGSGNPYPVITAKNARITTDPTELKLRDSGKTWAVKAGFLTKQGQKLNVTWTDFTTALAKWHLGQSYDLSMEVTAKPWNGRLYFNWTVLSV